LRGKFSRPEKLEKVLEKLATTEKTTLVLARDTEGKILVTSNSWPDERVILKDQVLEVRNVEGRFHVAPQTCHHENWDAPIESYPMYGPGISADENCRGVTDYGAVSDFRL
jgi:hypothetical protein